MSKVVILPGHWNKVKEFVKGSLDLRKFVRDVLQDMQVPFIDTCCPTLGVDVQTLTGAGAVSTTVPATLLVTTGANALTLAAGKNGQRKFIKMKTDGGDGTLTPNALQGGTTITFNDANDFVELIYLDGKWNIVVNSGATVA